MTFIDSPRPPSTPATRVTVARRLALVGAAGFTAVSVAACGSSTPSSTGPAAQPAPSTVASSSTPSPTATPTTTSLIVGRSIWYSGFEVALGEVVLTPTAGGADVVVEATFRNEGPKAASFPGVDLALESSGVSVLADASASELPQVPGQATGTGTFAFQVGPDFDLDAAVLTVGDAAAVQSVITLGSALGDVTNEPVDLGLDSPPARAGSVRLTLTDGMVRSDDPLTHRQLESGHALVDLTFDVRRFGGANATTFIGTDNLALRLPDGTTVAVRGDGISNPGELLAPGATIRDLHVRFEVPAAGRRPLRTGGQEPPQPTRGTTRLGCRSGSSWGDDRKAGRYGRRRRPHRPRPRSGGRPGTGPLRGARRPVIARARPSEAAGTAPRNSR